MPHAKSDEDKLRCSSCNSDDQEEQNITPAVPRKQNAHCDTGDRSERDPGCAGVGCDDRRGQRSEHRKFEGEMQSHRTPTGGPTAIGWGHALGTMVPVWLVRCIARAHTRIVTRGRGLVFLMSGCRPCYGLVSGSVCLYARFR